jgi:ATP-dependent RNA helicase DeaD
MSDIFDLSTTFAQMGLSDHVLKSLNEAGFEHPTHIQSQLIPPALAGRDLLGQAKTGTGKTAAFVLPILVKADPTVGSQALILAPTRELAVQIVSETAKLAKYTGIRAVSVVGGESYRDQVQGLKGGAHIIVGTPGRVMDLHHRGQLDFKDIRWVVLDEVDRMLDIGFREDIRKILARITSDHQTIFVSATLSEEIERLGRRYMKEDAEKICTVATSLTVSLVDQKYVPVKPWDKKRLLVHLLTHEEPALTLVFCRTKRTVSGVAKYLNDKGIEAFEIHGDLPQGKRNRIMQRFREGKLEVLVASDLASRGIDVEGITHIINYDLPEDPEVYVHRIGRTARAGRSGTAWSFVTPDQGQMLTDIEILTSVHIENLEYNDFQASPQPESWTAEGKGGYRPAPSAAPAEPPKSRSQETVGVPETFDAAAFPGGIVPKGPPTKTLGSRLKSRRGR